MTYDSTGALLNTEVESGVLGRMTIPEFSTRDSVETLLIREAGSRAEERVMAGGSTLLFI
jgi:hypothetical protein